MECSETQFHSITVAMILDGKLWTANVGDSKTILDIGIQLSEGDNPSALVMKFL